MDARVEGPLSAEEHLADAFSAFIAAANRLEDSHRKLHDEVARLRRELEERNRALASSLAENERIRTTLRQILDSLPCGVAVVEARNQEFTLLNPEGRKILNLPGELPSGDRLPDWLRAALVSADRSPHGSEYEQEISVENDGKKRWLAIRSSQMPRAASQTETTEAGQTILILRDVTWQKNAEQDRERARNIFALAEMSAVLAHEIRNPLGALELLARCLSEDSGLSDESKQLLEHLQAGVRSISATVSNVLRFHTPDAASMRSLELASVLKNSVEFVLPLARQRKVSIRLEQNLDGAQITGDPDALKQVMMNLFCNALRHTPPDGFIRATSRVEKKNNGNVAVIECSDTGSGIAPEILPNIFDPGFSTTGSSGLGLAVCRRILEQHRGSITARSHPGEGATFQVEIPAL
jgi:two-component system sensor histidine kinase FlrB